MVRAIIIALHKRARTTPAIRAAVAVLAARHGLGQGTIRRCKSRQVFHDASHTAHRLQTTLSPAQEAIVAQWRKMLLLSLDDLLAICRESSAPMSRARAWIDVCAVTRGQSEGVVLAASKAPAKRFKAYEPGHEGLVR